MKIITLNTWGGRKTPELLAFLKKRNDVDIFCFQEVYHDAHGKDTLWKDESNFDLFDKIKEAIPDYIGHYRPHLGDWWGLAIFIKKDLAVLSEGDFFVHKYNGHNPEIEVHGHTAKNVQFLTTEHLGKPFTIFHIHGLWNGMGKTDTEDRINQSKKIVEVIKKFEGEYVLCGDFNLNPETDSIKIITDGLDCRDLIKEFGVTSTRTPLYVKPGKFADYIFLSKRTLLADFKVLPDLLSDHNALEIEIK